MNSYADLSRIYDPWQEANDSSKWADYIEKILNKHNTKTKGDGAGQALLLLDLGCGTGSFAIEMAKRGYDVLGLDMSGDMLAVAREKPEASNVQFIQQDITRMELFGTVDIMVCLLDTVNHIVKESNLARFFKLCKNYLNPGGLLIFDMATPYYFEEVLGNQVFYDIKDSYTLVWQNFINKKKGTSESELTFFIQQEDQSYLRGEAFIEEKIHSTDKMTSLLMENGLTVLANYRDFSFQKPLPKTRRIFFVAENRQDDWKEKLDAIPFEKRGRYGKQN